MNAGPDISVIGALIGDPARANMLSVLMDGRALTATELAYYGGITPQTASSHLAKLTAANLLVMETQGRHRYFRLAGSAVAEAVEAMMVLATSHGPPRRVPSPPLEAVRIARTCYDHLAGALGVALTTAMVDSDFLLPEGRDFQLTEAGEEFLAGLGVDVRGARGKRRVFARQCLDWSERRPHLGGALGASFADRCFTLRWLRRVPESRAIVITPKGKISFATELDVELP